MKDWKFKPSPESLAEGIDKLSVFPREEDFFNHILRRVWHGLLILYFKIYHRLVRVNSQVLSDRDGPLIVVANHSSHLDAALLRASFPMKRANEVFALAAKDYFFQSLGRGILARVLMNAIPFDRTRGFVRGLRMTREVLRHPSHALILFPEGTRSSDGSLRPFKPGIGALAAGQRVRVIPAYLHGTHAALGKGSLFPKPWRLWAVFGQPRSFENAPANSQAWKEIAESLSRDVRELRRELFESLGLAR